MLYPEYFLRLIFLECSCFTISFSYTSKWISYMYTYCCLVKSCPTLWPYGLQPSKAPLSMGVPRQEYWSGLLFPSPGDLPDPGIKPLSPALAGRFFTAEPPEKPMYTYSPSFWTSFPFRSPQSTESSLLHYTVGSHWFLIQKVWYMYTMKYYSAIKKEWNWVIHRDVDGPRDCHTKWNKSEREKQISYIYIYKI